MNSILIGTVCFYYLYIFFLLFFMMKQRVKAIKNKEINGSYFKSYMGKTPEYLQVIQNHMNNQFQIPVIFFIACLFIIQQNAVTQLTVVVAIIFVISRMLHTYVHLGSNAPMKRAYSYMIGLICVGIIFLQTFIASL